MLLSAKIERAARELAAETDLDVSRRSVPLSIMIRSLVQAELLPFEAAEALNLFNQVRNQIVHGHDADDDEIARAIDFGHAVAQIATVEAPSVTSVCPLKRLLILAARYVRFPTHERTRSRGRVRGSSPVRFWRCW